MVCKKYIIICIEKALKTKGNCNAKVNGAYACGNG